MRTKMQVLIYSWRLLIQLWSSLLELSFDWEITVYLEDLNICSCCSLKKPLGRQMKMKSRRNHRSRLSKVNSVFKLLKKIKTAFSWPLFYISPFLPEKPGSVRFNVPIDIGFSTDDAYDFNTDFKWAWPSHWCSTLGAASWYGLMSEYTFQKITPVHFGQCVKDSFCPGNGCCVNIRRFLDLLFEIFPSF